jgi:predicted O-methyltransferase YrrM
MSPDQSQNPQDTWASVDRYFSDLLLPSDHADHALEAALEASVAAGLPAINVSPNKCKLLILIARVHGARRILEIGTLGGYSTIWLARALPAAGSGSGRVITLEYDPKHAEVARANLDRAGLTQVVDLRVGAALDTLPQLAAEGLGPFDFIFIDADKVNYPSYWTWSLKLSRPGSLIVIDNVVRNGGIVDANSSDKNIQGVRRFNELLAAETRVTATAIQTVGAKGYDGFAVALVNA